MRGNGRYPYPVRVVSTAPLQVLDDLEEYNEYCLDIAFSSIGKYLGTVAVVKQIKPEIECRSRPCLRSCCKQVCFAIFFNQPIKYFEKMG